MCFKVVCRDGKARTGVLKTNHGELKTPFFMPVVTKGTAKFVSHFELERIGFNCLIANAFINYLRPGLEIISKKKGLHNFISWKKGLFTDSGGFQLLSESFVEKISDKGVWFRNPFNQKVELITPEKAVEIQNKLGSDVAMCLDHVISPNSSRIEHLDSLIRTIEWAERCKSAHKNKNQLLFGITQGGVFPDLRKKSTIAMERIGFDGISVGGLCIGESPEKMFEMTKLTKKIISEERPVYLMGVGSPLEIIELISLGVDIFDSAYPTRMARHGKIFTSNGDLQISRGKFSKDFSPLDKNCDCQVCKRHSRAYLHHLFRSKEPNAYLLLSTHNLYFISNIIKNSCKAIENGSFSSFKKKFKRNYINSF